MDNLRPGYRLLSNGRQAYDIKAHINRAFEEVAPGVRLTVRDVLVAGQREDIPASYELGMGALVARLHWMSPRGIVVERDEDGRTVAYKPRSTSVTEQEKPKWLVDALADMQRTQKRSERMLLITLGCVILALAALSSIPLLFS